MSCRIVAPDQGSRGFAAQWPVTAALDPIAEEAQDEREAHSPQPAELQKRILELENSLQRQVAAARETGRHEGEQAGRDAAASEIAPVLDRMSRGVSELAGLRAKLRREAERDLVTLAVAIARRVLHREISVDADAIQGLVKSALERVQNKDACRVRTNPAYAAQMKTLLERLNTKADVVSDSSLQPGDFIVETKRGDLDASIDTQLQEIERGLADRIRH